jgi:excisionase family DNA binding protein
MIDLKHDALLSTAEAANRLNVTDRTLRYWIDRGVKGVHLDATWIGSRTMTSERALQEFADALVEVRTKGRTPTVSRARAIAEARGYLKSMGI